MFPAVLTRSDNGHVQRILIVALATLMLSAMMAIAPGAPAARADRPPSDYILIFADEAGTGAGETRSGVVDSNDISVTVRGVTMLIHLSCSELFHLYDSKTDQTVSRDHELWGFGVESGHSPLATTNPPQPRLWDFSIVHALQPGGGSVCGFNRDIPDVPGIHIEKATNSEDADQATGPQLVVGSTVTWTYVVTNTGNVPLGNVAVSDDMIDNATISGPTGDTGSDGILDLDETWTYTATGVATEGQYANTGRVEGYRGDTRVFDTDPSHYLGYIPDVPGIHIEKATNGADSDEAPGLPITVGEDVTWTYVVTNTGEVPLASITVTDDQGVVPVYRSGDTNGNDLLDVTETWTYDATGTALLINYANTGTVVGYYGDIMVTDDDPSHYGGTAVSGTAQLGDTVWLDKDKDGIQDADEPGLNGAKVNLKDANGTVIATLTTAKGAWDGFYKFLELDAGEYTAAIDMTSVDSKYELTTVGAFTIVLVDGDDFTRADFGLYAEEELPKTGIDSEGLTRFALGLLMLGTLAVLSTRRRRDEER